MYLHHFSVKSTKNLDPSTAVNGKVMYALSLEINTKSAVTMIFGSTYFV
jgi:hypothetical protein